MFSTPFLTAPSPKFSVHGNEYVAARFKNVYVHNVRRCYFCRRYSNSRNGIVYADPLNLPQSGVNDVDGRGSVPVRILNLRDCIAEECSNSMNN